ncbi:10872_t:CDS:1, partial [Ambispora gerdemannii]
ETKEDDEWDTTSIPWMITMDDSDSNGNNNETGTPYKKQHEQMVSTIKSLFDTSPPDNENWT